MVASVANAYRLYTYRMIGGLANVTWTIYNYDPQVHPSIYSFNYESIVLEGVSAWNTATSIGFTRRPNGTTNNCKVYFVFGDYGNDNFFGGCWFYDANGNRVSGANYTAPTSNYEYVFIRCNNYFLQGFAERNHLKSFFAHELGHTFGIDHSDASITNSERTLMHSQTVRNYATYRTCTPQSDDITAASIVYSS